MKGKETNEKMSILRNGKVLNNLFHKNTTDFILRLFIYLFILCFFFPQVSNFVFFIFVFLITVLFGQLELLLIKIKN